MSDQGQPSQNPPTKGAASSGAEEARPRDLTAAELTMSASAAQAAGQPTMDPPPTSGAAAGAQAVGTWNSNKKITALWSMNQNRNVWVAIDGVGWKKLSTASDSATEALGIISAVAKQTQSPYVSYREEADGMIHEMYVW